MESPKEQKPIPLDYASPSMPQWVEWRVGRRIKLGVGLAVLWWVLYFGLEARALRYLSFIDIYGISILRSFYLVLLFPFRWLSWWTYPEAVPTPLLLLADSVFWGFGIAFVLHRRRRKRRASLPPEDGNLT